MRPRRAASLLLACCLLVGGCVVPDAGEGGQRQPESRDDGVQLTGTLDQQRISISSGAPDVVVGDCDPGDGLDDDVCFVTRTIDGATIAVVFENPAVLVPGATVDVVTSDCTTCDDVTDGLVVDIRQDGEQRRVPDGRVEVTAADERYTGQLRFDFVNGDRLVGTFDIRPPRPGEL